jgi:uncharacterized protein
MIAHYSLNEVRFVEEIAFDWDEYKAKINKEDHNVSFEEAKTVFYREDYRVSHDLEHSQDEDRFRCVGMSADLNLLVVCHVPDQNEHIRIISARKASKQERKQYWALYER